VIHSFSNGTTQRAMTARLAMRLELISLGCDPEHVNGFGNVAATFAEAVMALTDGPLTSLRYNPQPLWSNQYGYAFAKRMPGQWQQILRCSRP